VIEVHLESATELSTLLRIEIIYYQFSKQRFRLRRSQHSLRAGARPLLLDQKCRLKYSSPRDDSIHPSAIVLIWNSSSTLLELCRYFSATLLSLLEARVGIAQHSSQVPILSILPQANHLRSFHSAKEDPTKSCWLQALFRHSARTICPPFPYSVSTLPLLEVLLDTNQLVAEYTAAPLQYSCVIRSQQSPRHRVREQKQPASLADSFALQS